MADTRKRFILFVDDEQQVLNATRRRLHSYRARWSMFFVTSGVEALEIMAEQAIDVIVSDMRMPGMDGAVLLNEVKQRYAGTIRIALSGYADSKLVLEGIQSIHTYLSKPAETELIVATIERSLSLQESFCSPRLQQLVAKMGTLPSLPNLYSQVSQEMSSANSSLQKVSLLIAQDIGMSTKMLQLVNSAFFGLEKDIDSAAHAVAYLGIETVKTLVLALGLFDSFTHKGVDADKLSRLWRNAQSVSTIATQIAKFEQLSEIQCNTAMTAGLLHDLGTLILLISSPVEYNEVEQLVSAGANRGAAEEQIFGVKSSVVGAYLISLWGLPATLVEAILLSQHPHRVKHGPMGPAKVVYIANWLVINREFCSQDSIDTLLDELDMSQEKYQSWRLLTQNVVQLGEDKNDDR